jgi:hypothetical protein
MGFRVFQIQVLMEIGTLYTPQAYGSWQFLILPGLMGVLVSCWGTLIFATKECMGIWISSNQRLVEIRGLAF